MSAINRPVRSFGDLLRRISYLLLLGGMQLGGGHAACPTGMAAWGQDALPGPRAVADDYLRLVMARPVSVDVLRESTSAELPYARLRLIVAKSLDGGVLRGVDAHGFRDTGRISRIDMPLPSGAFRDRIEQALRASAAYSTARPSDESLRTVDVWCANTDVAGTYHPLIVKVWDDNALARNNARNARENVPGRLCHADVPFIVECQAAFDYQPTTSDAGIDDLSLVPETPERMALAIGRRRDLIDAASRKARAAGEARTVPVPGGVRFEATGFGALPPTLCRHEGTVTRTQAGEACLGLADGVSEGSCMLSFETPFPIGGAALRATFETVDRSSSIEVEASTDGSWKSLLRISDRPTRLRDHWVLPSSLSGGNRLRIRVRMKSADGEAGGDGPRTFVHRLDVPIGHRLVDEGGVLRLVELPSPMSYASAKRPSFQVVIQRDRIPPADLVAMLQTERGGVIDVYAPCDLDAAVCSAMADHGGTIRFWSLSPWQQSPPACLDLLVSGTGSIVFPRLPEITALLAAVVGGGRKSLAFPAVKTADASVLEGLAACSGELALDGLEQLSPDEAAVLGRYAGPRLSLAAMGDIRVAGIPSKPFLRAAVSSPGTLILEGPTNIDEQSAGILAAGEKHILMDGMPALPPRVAAALATARGGLSLDGVVSLDRDSVRELLPYSGAFLSLRGLRHAACRIDDLPTAKRAGSAKDLAAALAPPSPVASAKTTPWTGAMKRPKVLMEGDRESAGHHSRMWMNPPDVLPLDALLQVPGVFRLEPAEGDQGGELDVATVAMLTRGGKDLDLDGFSKIAPEAFRELCRSQQMISMSGLREIPDGCLPDLCSYTGRMFFLDGIGTLDEERIKSLSSLIEEDRISLTGADIHNIRALRKYAKKMDRDLRRIDGEALRQFLERSDAEEWPGIPRRAMVCLLSSDKVMFGATTDEKQPVTGDRNKLSKNSVNRLDTLAKCAGKVAAARKMLLLPQPRTTITPGPEQ